MGVKERSQNIVTYPNAQAPESDMTAGRFVTIDTNGVVAYATNGERADGLLAQDVKSTEHLDIIRLGKNTAFYGGKVGVYMCGGLFETDQTAVAINAGDLLYVSGTAGEEGMLTNVDPTAGSGFAVAQALTGGNAGEYIWIKLLV